MIISNFNAENHISITCIVLFFFFFFSNRIEMIVDQVFCPSCHMVKKYPHIHVGFLSKHEKQYTYTARLDLRVYSASHTFCFRNWHIMISWFKDYKIDGKLSVHLMFNFEGKLTMPVDWLFHSKLLIVAYQFINRSLF